MGGEGIIPKRNMRNRTYIAADFDHDENAVKHLHWMNSQGLINYLDAHELQQSNDSSLACSIKKSLKYRMDNSYKFVLIVGSHTDTVSKGGCQLCQSYNPSGKYCIKGNNIDYRSFIRFECDKALEEGLKIVVLYNSTVVNRDLCPIAIRWEGTHQKMIFRGTNGQFYWDNNVIRQAFNG